MVFSRGKGAQGANDNDAQASLSYVWNTLSRLLKLRTVESDLNYHPRSLKLTHLGFADDLILMARVDITSVEILLNSLEHFGLRNTCECEEPFIQQA